MRRFSYIVALFTALALMGCGGRQKKEAAAPETNPWADYKGTFATGVPTKEELKKADEAENPKKADAPKKNEKTDSKSFVASNKKTPESKAAESKVPEVKPVPASDARSMYNETSGDSASAGDASEEAAPAPKKGGKKGGAKKGGGKKGGGAKKKK